MKAPASQRRIELYDTTLRDGSQGEGITFSLVDKLKITEHLDALGMDYIEGGYPLSNPKDEAFFREVALLKLSHAKVCAFGMTRRRGVDVRQDEGMLALVGAKAGVITIVGKTWDLHVDEVLRISRQENLDMIQESVGFCHQESNAEVFYDAEHFFDGYRANAAYSLETLRAAVAGGATRLILCDTNGGSLPAWISQVIAQVRLALMEKMEKTEKSETGPSAPGLGIHVHNDGGLAVANSLAAVEAGCVQVQGTINGIGERCGNVDLTTVAANLALKLGFQCLQKHSLARLTETSRYVYEKANLNLLANQPFVGSAAFAHKGGMHVHAVQRVARSYEHVEPQLVGNTRRILVSELSGASNISAAVGAKFNIASDRKLQRQLLERVQDLEHQGYQFEAATASFELLLHQLLGTQPRYWELEHYRCSILKNGCQQPTTEAIVKLQVGADDEHHVAEGDGPINALDGALRKCVEHHYPQLGRLHLRDYKVRVVNPTAESAAKVRVVIEFAVRQENGSTSLAPGESAGVRAADTPSAAADSPSTAPPQAASYFTTIGVSENIVDASWQALVDAFTYHLIETKVPAVETPAATATPRTA